eukprot:TRINITY_DN12943_c0_g1_i1.p1 TRINITY_DN12943_c0_g1~~TRINITY_DN12943_c0_g1_i1.p1  ORF type:complete len:163 (+),score=23.34 TRINITY_DN12943_c0_g1_i1:63-491(+)
MKAFKTAEVTTSVALLNWGQIAGFGMAMNKWVWDDLTSEQQQLMRSIGSEMIDFYAEKVISENQEVIDALPTGNIGNKVEVIEWSDEERAKLFAYSDKYAEEWVQDMNDVGLDGEAIWAEYRALLNKYDTERKEQGYPWDRS